MEEGYLNFDEYIRQGEPSQREKAGYWQTAICLQAEGIELSAKHGVSVYSPNGRMERSIKSKHPDKYPNRHPNWGKIM